MITAVIVSSSPHLGHPLRFVGRVLVGVVAVTAVGLGIAYPIGALAGFLVGVAAAAVVHLIIGSPAGRPSPKRVAGALSDLGLEDAAVVDLPTDRVGASQSRPRLPTSRLGHGLGRDSGCAGPLPA
jgi:hypothetical protein